MKYRSVFSVFVTSLITVFPAATLAIDEELEDLTQLRHLLEEQQAVIADLLDNQRRQGREIDALRAQLGGVIGETATPSAVNSDAQLVSSTVVEKQAAEVVKPAWSTSPVGSSISVGGHINRAINVVDDGANTDSYYVDNGNIPTFAYLKASVPVNENLTIGGHIEYALRQNSALLASQENPDAGFNTAARYFEMTLDDKRYGKLYFGRGFMSSFLAAEIDQSKTYTYNLLSVGNSFGGMKFVKESDDSLSDLGIGQVFIDGEAFSFRDRVRYDSPRWAGFQLSGSVGTGDSSDVTLRWRQSLGKFDFVAGASVQDHPFTGRIESRVDGGIGVYHQTTGLSFTVAAVSQKYVREFYQDFGRDDGDNSGYTARLGWRKNWFGLGETRIAVDYAASEDVLYQGDDALSSGIFLSQFIDAWNIEPYIGYRLYDYDAGPNANGMSLKDLSGWTLGARIAFGATLN